MADPYRATRRLERFFGYRGPDTLRTPRPPQTNSEKPEGELIATIIYDFENGQVKCNRPGELEKRVKE